MLVEAILLARDPIAARHFIAALLLACAIASGVLLQVLHVSWQSGSDFAASLESCASVVYC